MKRPAETMNHAEPISIRRVEEVFCWGAITLYLAPIWFFDYLPTQDGPQHLHSAEILYDLAFEPQSPAHEYYSSDWRFQPNLACPLALLFLLNWFAALTAEKIYITVYVVLLAVAYRWFLAASKSSVAFVPLALLVVYATPFQMGFYSFCVSFALSWLILAIYRHWELAPRWRHGAVFAALYLLCYFAHLVGAAAAAVIAVSMALASNRRHKLIAIQLIGIVPIGLAAAARITLGTAPLRLI